MGVSGGNLGLQSVEGARLGAGLENLNSNPSSPTAMGAGKGGVQDHMICPRGCVFHRKEPPRIEYPQRIVDEIYDHPIYEKLQIAELHQPEIYGNDDIDQSITINWLGQTATILSEFDYSRTLIFMLLAFMSSGQVGV